MSLLFLTPTLSFVRLTLLSGNLQRISFFPSVFKERGEPAYASRFALETRLNEKMISLASPDFSTPPQLFFLIKLPVNTLGLCLPQGLPNYPFSLRFHRRF